MKHNIDTTWDDPWLVELHENNKPPFALMLCDHCHMLNILLLTIDIEIWGIELGCLKENLMKSCLD